MNNFWKAGEAIRQTIVRFEPLLKGVWFVAVALALAYYFYRYGDEFMKALNGLSWATIAIAVGLTLCAKLITALQMARTLKMGQVSASVWKYLQLYSYPDIAKYLPGGVWGLVGRIVMYHRMGIRAKVITKVFALEHFWLIAGSLSFGTSLYLVFGQTFLAEITGLSAMWFAVAGIAIVVLWTVLATSSIRAVVGRLTSRSVLLSLSVVVEQAVMWAMYGSAFWILMQGAASQWLVVGVVAISFSIGFLAFFAPAGIGVREVVAVSLLAPMALPEEILAASLIYRACYFLADIIMAAAVFGLSELGLADEE